MSKLHEFSLVGKRVYGYNSYRFCDDLEFPLTCEIISPIVDTKSSSDVLFDNIFSVNPRTKLPDCDITVFMSENTSDSVKKFIQDNLMSDNGGVSDSSKYPDLSDEFIAEFTRSQSETIYQYRDRVYKYVQENVLSKKDDDKNDKS